MSLSQMLLPEFDQEMATTRRVLERLPADKFDFKPAEKSMPLGRLASHIAEMPDWYVVTLTTESLDFAPPGGPPYKPVIFATPAEVLRVLDKNVKAAREALLAVSDETLGQPWSLLMGGNPIFTLPRIAALRGMVLNHLIHHRGQLTVYYRLTGVPVPAVYGPSADEQAP